VLLTGQTKQAQLELLETQVQPVTLELVQDQVGLAELHLTRGLVLRVRQAMLETSEPLVLLVLAQLPAILAEPLLPTGLEKPEQLVMPELLVLPVLPELELAQAEVAVLLLLTGQVNLVLPATLEELRPLHRS